MTQAASRFKVIVFDDDPTGSQTVHSCPLLLRWDGATLRWGLAQPSPLLFVLANTRALAPREAAERVREICRVLRPLLAEAQAAGTLDHWLIVSRGDSTLRGHFPLEAEVITEELGPFDATLLVPAFLEGGRTTRGAVHRLHGQPVHETPFARDGLFGFRHSDLRLWVEEKTAGRIPATAVEHLSWQELEGPAPDLYRRLAVLEHNVTVAVDAERPEHLAALARALRELSAPLPAAVEACADPAEGDLRAAAAEGLFPASEAAIPAQEASLGPAAPSGIAAPAPAAACHEAVASGTAVASETAGARETAVAQGTAVAERPVTRPRRFLIQSAAGLVGALADLPPQPLAAAGLASLRRRDGEGRGLPGLVLVGSHVPLADQQLERLLADPGCSGVELAVPTLQRVLEGPLPDRLLPSLEASWRAQLEAVLAAGRTPVLFTSRGEVTCARATDRRALGLALAGLMARLAAALEPRLGYLISKGGITTHTLLADGLGVAAVQLQGQLLPGLSLVLAGPGTLPVITFPGNLGDAGSLHEAWRRMEGAAPAPGPP